MGIEDDFTGWEIWWEFNKDRYLGLKASIHSNTVVSGSDIFYLGGSRRMEAQDSQKPTDEDKRNNVLPALKRAIDSTDNRDINSSCMVAMAKVGADHPPEFKLRDVFAPRLQKNDQEVAETAALALGIAALPDAENLDLLVALAKDSETGRRACGREVTDRTRAFACYGLGLVAWANADVGLKRTVFAALRDLVDDDKVSSRNIKVAAINAIGLLNVGTSDDAGKTLVGDALKCLEGYYSKNLGPGEQLLQAHVPPAVAKLLGKAFYDGKVVEDWKALFAADLAADLPADLHADLHGKGRQKRTSLDICRSCVLALAQLCKPCDDDKAADARYCKQLLHTWHNHKDAQTRYFAILALGQIGGAMNRSTLLEEFDKPGTNRVLEKPWVGIAMGVYAFAKYENQRAAKVSVEIEREFGRVLAAALDDIKNPEAQSAFAVALGLCQYRDAAPELRAMLARNASKDDLAGYLCTGLALMDDQPSKEVIRGIVGKSVRRPELFKQAAIALGKLGDSTVADDLQQLLAVGDTNLAKMSAIASALAFIGDRRSIEPLKQMLFDESLTGLSRAFAAVALGGVADKEELPWNSKIGQNLNYRAAVETLTGGSMGILDIL